MCGRWSTEEMTAGSEELLPRQWADVMCSPRRSELEISRTRAGPVHGPLRGGSRRVPYPTWIHRGGWLVRALFVALLPLALASPVVLASDQFYLSTARLVP